MTLYVEDYWARKRIQELERTDFEIKASLKDQQERLANLENRFVGQIEHLKFIENLFKTSSGEVEELAKKYYELTRKPQT